MSKLSAVFIFSAICFFGFYSNNSISKNISATVTATATPPPNDSNDSFTMTLDRDTFIPSCPMGYRCIYDNGNSKPIVVTVSNTKLDDNSFQYKYTTTGGRVIGEGAKVSWNLTGGQPGTYQITVAIEGKSGKELQRITKTITVLHNQDDSDRCLTCPMFSVDPPTTSIQAGEMMIFTANVRYGDAANMIYNWTISDGKIIEGQGTPTIKVATTSKMAGKSVEANVNFIWDCSDICKDNTASASAIVAKRR